MLFENIREEQELVYSIGAAFTINHYPKPYYNLLIYFKSDPKNNEIIFKKIDEVIQNLKNNNYPDHYIEDAKLNRVNKAKELKQSNSFLAMALSSYLFENQPLTTITQLESSAELVKAHHIQYYINEIANDNYIQASLLPSVKINLRKYKDQYCYDGDTCYVTVDGANTKIRLLELDTPEISKPKCEAELELGLIARDYLNNLIAKAATIEFKTDYEEDYFGRILAHLIIDGEDVSAKIVNNNVGVVYDRNNKKDWCT